MPPYGIAQFYDQVYNDDPFNINRRDSEIIIGADGKAKTIPILPMTSDEIMAGSVIPPDFDAERFQSVFPTSGIMSQTQFVEDDDLEASAIPRFGEDELKQSRGIGDLFRAALGFVVPGANFFLNKGRDAMSGIRSLNQRLRNTDFGRSKNLMDYLDIKSYGGYDEREDARAATMTQARGIQKKIDAGDYGTPSNQDRARGQTPSRTTSTSKKSSSRQSRQTSGPGGLHSNY